MRAERMMGKSGRRRTEARCRAAGMSAAMTRTPELHALQLVVTTPWRCVDGGQMRSGVGMRPGQANFVQKTRPPRRADADVITQCFNFRRIG